MADRVTQKLISQLSPPTRRSNCIHYDSEIPGFGVRITNAGAISFVLNYWLRGRERRFTIGRHPELTATAARERALELRGKILKGEDPLEQRERERREPAMTDLTSDYLTRYATTHKRPTSLRNDRQMIEGIIDPQLGHLRVTAIGRRDIEALHASLKATPYRANRVLALLSKMFELAAEWGWRPDNPARHIPRFHEDRRERWLQADELKRFDKALRKYHDKNAAAALRLLLLTGAREGEVLKADWSQFDLNAGTWTKPSHHTKQNKIEHVPLSAEALKLLRALKPKAAVGPLFPGKNGKPRTTLHRPWVQVCRAARLVDIIELKGKRRKKVFRYKPTLRIHDLRHTYASHLVSTGVPLQVVGKLLGHTQPSTTARYAHLADDALRAATDSFGKTLAAAAGKR